jgi:nucleolar protein 14
MAGSQLKQLKAELKSKGLIGQTNIKKKNQKSKTPSETRRNDQQKIIAGIRSQFNQFDERVNRSKHDFTIIQGGKFVKAGSKQHNDVSRTQSKIEKSMKLQYDLEKAEHGKVGGVTDRRFGENNKHMTNEEKMLERFTRERQGSQKKNVFSLGSDEEDNDDDDGFMLTHSGKVINDEDQESPSNPRYVDEDQVNPDLPPRKKTKQEVMKEVIAKSKFYKKQRQQEFRNVQELIGDLDDEFGDVMMEMGTLQGSVKPNVKTQEEKEYDSKVRELTYDRRSVPADRTKTEEEIRNEHDEKMKKLEADRLNRMNGVDTGDVAGDDLEDDFWAGSDEEGEEGEEGEDNEDEDMSESSSDETLSKPLGRTLPQLIMPSTQEELSQQLSKLEVSKYENYINKLINTYKPNLAMGNKDKMNTFVGVLFEQVLSVSEEEDSQPKIEVLVKIIKKLSEKYNQVLVETVRVQIQEIQDRILEQGSLILLESRDFVFFLVIGYLFSTSDHYHLIVTPTIILMNLVLSSVVYDKATIRQIGQGIFLVDTLLNYQRFSKRYIPEVVNFLEKSMLILAPEAEKLNKSTFLSTSSIVPSPLALFKGDKVEVAEEESLVLGVSDVVSGKVDRHSLLLKLLMLVDRSVTLWKDLSAEVEIIAPFIVIIKHLVKYYGSIWPKNTGEVLKKLVKIHENLVKERVPLTLQYHRSLAIATFAPKFEENFNPDKKSYDVNRERQEMSKVKNELKKERKSALKDIRRETKFVARERISEKKGMYDAYHKKMADIVNSIASTEGAEKNQYEREKKMRKSRK